MFRSRLQQKIPLTEYLVCCVCVLFSKAKTMLRIGTCVRFCCYNILIPSHYVRRRFPAVRALEFRCWRKGALAPIRNRKTVEKIIQNRKNRKKIRSKPKTACKTVKNRYIFTSQLLKAWSIRYSGDKWTYRVNYTNFMTGFMNLMDLTFVSFSICLN